MYIFIIYIYYFSVHPAKRRVSGILLGIQGIRGAHHGNRLLQDPQQEPGEERRGDDRGRDGSSDLCGGKDQDRTR